MASSGNAVALMVSPNAADAELAVRFLRESNIEGRAFATLSEALPVLDEEAGCLILVEEALVADELPAVRDALRRMPAWADLPLLVASRNVGLLARLTAEAFPESGNVTLLERPLNPHTLISAVQVALRATARQREIGELLEQRSQAIKSRDEFLAMLAHELRNPLAPMRNAVYIMRRLKVEDPALRSTIPILERQVNHISRMVDDLLDVARLERGKVALKKQPVDLNRVVASAVESCLPTAQQRGHRMVVNFDTRALPAEADTVRVEQIVCNLVNNAIKFTAAPGDIRIETRTDGDFAAIVVEDTGVGFEPAKANELFDPFLQASPTLERTAGGLGIGLTIVRRLASLHGGSVEASSEGPGKGSRFVVRIPLASTRGEADAERKEPDVLRRRRRVVVIEDNPDIRETLSMLLDMWGHEVVLAADGRSGVDRVLEERPDVALIDVGLPGMNGYEVAREIRKHIPDGALRLIAVTGYGQPSDREAAAQAGFDRHLLKPIEPEILERVLAE